MRGDSGRASHSPARNAIVRIPISRVFRAASTSTARNSSPDTDLNRRAMPAAAALAISSAREGG